MAGVCWTDRQHARPGGLERTNRARVPGLAGGSWGPELLPAGGLPTEPWNPPAPVPLAYTLLFPAAGGVASATGSSRLAQPSVRCLLGPARDAWLFATRRPKITSLILIGPYIGPAVSTKIKHWFAAKQLARLWPMERADALRRFTPGGEAMVRQQNLHVEPSLHGRESPDQGAIFANLSQDIKYVSRD